MDLQKLNIMKRLNRIEGQVKGIQRMVNEDKYCMDVLTQVAAVRAAINKVGVIILENYSKTCLKSAFDSEDSDKRAKAFDELVNTINKFLKFIE
ncbi:MAG TPA: metal-sensitive transcriptional regulator [Clostridiales bacterium]|nr:metal-sensitive transcriptional regulator [Clostridiales bacterium]